MEPMKKWKIISDGTSDGTKIISPSGEIVGMVQKISIVIECGEPLPRLDIEVEESSFSSNMIDCVSCTPPCANGVETLKYLAKKLQENQAEANLIQKCKENK